MHANQIMHNHRRSVPAAYSSVTDMLRLILMNEDVANKIRELEGIHIFIYDLYTVYRSELWLRHRVSDRQQKQLSKFWKNL